MDARGEKSAFIQVATNRGSWNFTFPFSEFSVSRKKLALKIGLNVFSQNGIWVNLQQGGLQIKGRINYREPRPIKYNIMGPFSFLPFMECNHGILSLFHTLKGSLHVDGDFYDFSGGRGYIEQDWGRSFPQKYIWLQTNDFPQGCLFLSIARIPYLGRAFTGCICILYFNQTEYRLATYLGAKIIHAGEDRIVLKQKEYTLQIHIQNKDPQKLLAPSLGEMTRTIHESASCHTHIEFFRDGKKIFERESGYSSFEYAE